MSTHKQIDRICCGVLVLMLLLTIVFMNAGKLGVQAVSRSLGYESKLFDTSIVHTIDIEMEDWDTFLEGCTDEEYVSCSLVIDQEAYQNVAIRAKGNTSLTSVASYGNDRYSFKVEFDHYEQAKTYYGLDKLCLNNIIQDNTYMKDYVSYQMMAEAGVASPLCSFVYITVNGEDFGLYLAVEGVEESFLERNYGTDYGELYKPDSMSMGGGRGNGAGFDPGEGGLWEDGNFEESPAGNSAGRMNEMPPEDMENFGGQAPPEGMESFEGQMPPEDMENFGGQVPPEDMGVPNTEMSSKDISGSETDASGVEREKVPGKMTMGSEDVSLIYTDDEYDSYTNIFENAKTKISDSDKDRLIASLKNLNEGENIEDVVDEEEVIRYFVVHNFVCNFDSYTGFMINNYYLYEKDGQLSMIPWDYNLAFGGFESGTDAQSLVNYPIDSPVSGGTVESRPMLAWIFADEKYTELYHQYFSEFLSQYFINGEFEKMIDTVSEMIAQYVEKDPTKFCSYEEFQEGVSTLKTFCSLRAESIQGQLDGTISSTGTAQQFLSEEQQTEAFEGVEAGDLAIETMGTMGNTFGPGGGPGKFAGASEVFADEGAEGTEGSEGGTGIKSEDTGGEIGIGPEGSEGGTGIGSEDTDGEIGIGPEGTGEESHLGSGGVQEKTDPGAEEFEGRFKPQDMGAMAQPEVQRKDMGNIWIMTGLSFIVLFTGIIYACRFKRYS
ncbi:spore coat protein CotH [Schaedlerella arabinosiphila]|uniref:Spore coat protein CotH n=1 Tax=Schaedlerella arabinosiphila TaxID=2044587 RepID=A0A9X5C790_9FIRM|nr:CotH kinase family protein [Schaedlerella arabinosiphila]NDO69046.1 spore coat protein CotH [Schaedlerella arabinosiphila]